MLCFCIDYIVTIVLCLLVVTLSFCTLFFSGVVFVANAIKDQNNVSDAVSKIFKVGSSLAKSPGFVILLFTIIFLFSYGFKK